ncbi:MAG: hypothetical protein L3J35_01065 [Bacteroidales bacterium]|nr:hypothetical protein [Bacteroidales bacterium]
MVNRKVLIYVILLFCIINTKPSFSQSIVNSKHNLSVSGIGNVKSTGESEICIFCHTSHSSNPKTPLWNKKTPGLNYILYNSSTIQAVPGQPDGSSILCLSCHDGTIALGSVLSKKKEIDFSEGANSFKRSKNNLTTDLSDDHMISFEYTSALAYTDGELRDPMNLTHPVALENGKVQCISCHDPHNNKFDNFLVRSNRYSELCLSCHDKDYWFESGHRNSTAKWNGSGKNPWFHTKYTTVAENACENCHNTHTAGGNERLMKYQKEESNCLDCHNGNVASQNIQIQINKPYSHNVYAYNRDHDPNEDALTLNMHVECEDCHNPHGSDNSPGKAPFVKGFNKGTVGVNQDGNKVNPVQFEYEICYRCHADSPNKSASSITRQIEQNNVRLEFNSLNPSFHPVTGTGVNPDVPSLVAPYSESSIIYCTDCHASNGKSSAAGPHGSIYPHILKYNYSTFNNTIESYQSYELCYQCHDRNSIISEYPNEFQDKVHNKHIVDLNTSCSVCHDSHGVSSFQGNSVNNSNLINFNVSIVSPADGILRFEDTGLFSGTCYLTCHGKVHNPKSYK